VRVRTGDTVWAPPGEEHWHGGAATHLMCHLAMLEGSGGGVGTTWLEAVSDEDHAAANRAT
jgi:quercetin dioxygenase-like cupin family protein